MPVFSLVRAPPEWRRVDRHRVILNLRRRIRFVTAPISGSGLQFSLSKSGANLPGNLINVEN